MSGKSVKKNKKNKKREPIDNQTLYINWQRKAVAAAATAVNMADAGHMTDKGSRIYLDAMEFALIFGHYLGNECITQ